MPGRWYRLNETGDGTEGDPIRPDFNGYEPNIDGWTGNKSHPDGAPFWVVRVFASEAVHNGLEGSLTQGAKPLDNVPVEALNNMFGQA